MGSGTTNAVVAVLGGGLLAALLVVPWVALRYRRRGSVGLGDLLLGLGVSVYAVAVLAYTLLPLPTSDAEACAGGTVGPQLHWAAFVDDVRRLGGIDGPASLLTNPAAAQVLLNVALFVPLGAFLRHLTRRGLVTGVALATAAGLTLSLLVELTQLTGVWGLYPCAYRLFDVDDLLANTAGALLGSFAAPALRLVPGQRDVAPDQVRSVTLLRRLLGMASDVVAVSLLAGGLSAGAVVLDLLLGAADGLTTRTAVLLGLVPAVGQLLLVLTTGRTLGEAVVRLRPVPHPRLLPGLVRWALGIGGWTVLGALDQTLLQLLLTLAAVVGLVVLRDRRGLASAAAGLRVLDDRDPRVVRPPRRRPAPAASASGSPPR